MAGLLVRFFYRNKPYINFSGFDGPHNHDTDPMILDWLADGMSAGSEGFLSIDTEGDHSIYPVETWVQCLLLFPAGLNHSITQVPWRRIHIPVLFVRRI